MNDAKESVAPKPWGIFNTLTVGLLGFANSTLIGAVMAFACVAIFGRGILKSIPFNLYFLVVSNLAFLFVIVIFLIISKHNIKEVLGLNTPRRHRYWLYVFPAFFAYIALNIFLNVMVRILFPDVDLEQNQDIVFKDAKAISDMILSAIALLVIAPVTEELVFRGFIFKGIKNSFGFVTAAIISSMIFGLVHGQVNVAIDTFCLGILLCYLYEKTDSIWPSIALHSIKNTVAFILIFLIM